MKVLFDNLSLRGKLTAIIMFTGCLVFLLTFITFLVFQRANLRTTLLQDSLVLCQTLGENCASALIFNDHDSATETLQVLTEKSNIIDSRVYTNDKRIFAAYHRHLIEHPEIDRLPTQDPLTQNFKFSPTDLTVFKQVTYQGEVLGTILLRTDLSTVNDALMRYTWMGIIGFVLYSCLAFLIASFLQRLISKPIEDLSKTMRTIALEKNYSQRVTQQRNDELGSLFKGFNNMLAEIEARDTELQANEARLDHLAHHDPLTQLSNRRLLHARIEHTLSQARRSERQVAILLIDLDQFKKINDSLGHAVGDEVLRAVAGRLKKHSRTSDTLARIGGDEFVIVLEHINSPDDVTRYLQGVLESLGQAIKVSGHELYITASVGVSLFPENGEDVEELMRSADVAMYKAKDSGRNTFRFNTPGMNDKAHGQLLLESELHKALEQEQFVLHYQPQIELNSGRIIGFEALIRWMHPERGLIPPGDFIPLAEESGLIVPIGEWVLNSACLQSKRWQAQGRPEVRIAVNVSARQFRQKTLIQTVEQALQKHQLPPHCLELEITESMVMDNVESAIVKMKALNDMGVQLSIDDFGTGYSSLSALKRFPLANLKIDRSFIQDIVTAPEDAAISASIIALGKNMSLKIIAEGIETVEQMDALNAKGCEHGQGFYFCKPMTPENLEEIYDKCWISSCPKTSQTTSAAQRPKEVTASG
ncbi:MAG: GGDEF domain-containing protein [Desulfuromonas sp.]|nr:MAG: GGDEF domain-containing protein [Desulfuromonas sp.]